MHLICCLLLAFPVQVSAEIEKIAVPSGTSLNFYWWPKIDAPDGWFHDEASSYHSGINAFAPLGSSFRDADTVIYANANFKEAMPEVTSLEQYIEQDKAGHRAWSASSEILDADTLETADGSMLVTIKIRPGSEGNWERVAYGEQGEFYLTFVLSSRNEEGFRKAEPIFESFVHSYLK